MEQMHGAYMERDRKVREEASSKPGDGEKAPPANLQDNCDDYCLDEVVWLPQDS